MLLGVVTCGLDSQVLQVPRAGSRTPGCGPQHHQNIFLNYRQSREILDFPLAPTHLSAAKGLPESRQEEKSARQGSLDPGSSGWGAAGGVQHPRLRYLIARFADVRPIPPDAALEKPGAAVASVDAVVLPGAAVAAHFAGDVQDAAWAGRDRAGAGEVQEREAGGGREERDAKQSDL